MSPEKSDNWIKARRAHDKLVEQFLDHPEVSLIDIGYQRESKRIVLQVHLRRQIPREIIGIPEEVEGIPVHVLLGDYELE